MGLSGDSAGKESACHSGNLGLIPGLGRAPGSSQWEWLPTQVFLPGKFHGKEEPGRLQSMVSQRV